jgi:hypothetical protein
LPDPPFVQGVWAVAEFSFPADPGLNGSVSADTAAIQSATNCANPSETNITQSNNGKFTIQATSTAGCSQEATFDPTTASQQFGVVNVPNCGNATDITFQPVMFWFAHLKADSTPEARTVFCTPTLSVFNVQATANLNNGSLVNITIGSKYSLPNNVTGNPLNGQAYNGVIFDTNDDALVQARATATNNGVPGAIFRFASQTTNGPQAVFDDPSGFLKVTDQIYTQYLSASAKSIYFIGATDTIPAEMTSLIPRLWIEYVLPTLTLLHPERPPLLQAPCRTRPYGYSSLHWLCRCFCTHSS